MRLKLEAIFNGLFIVGILQLMNISSKAMLLLETANHRGFDPSIAFRTMSIVFLFCMFISLINIKNSIKGEFHFKNYCINILSMIFLALLFGVFMDKGSSFFGNLIDSALNAFSFASIMIIVPTISGFYEKHVKYEGKLILLNHFAHLIVIWLIFIFLFIRFMSNSYDVVEFNIVIGFSLIFYTFIWKTINSNIEHIKGNSVSRLNLKNFFNLLSILIVVIIEYYAVSSGIFRSRVEDLILIILIANAVVLLLITLSNIIYNKISSKNK